MKTKPALLICLLVFSAQIHAFAANPMRSVNEKTLKAFKDAYPKAEKVVWKENEEYYFVYFKDNGISSQIDYDHDGNFMCSLRYYSSADMLPLHLALELQKKYPGKTIYGITEANSESGTEYFVKLEDKTEWLTVKGTADGSIMLVEKFYKQN